MADLDGVVIYSAIYGGYDEPKPLPPGLDVPAIMFTDRLETAHRASALGWRSFLVPHGIVTAKGDPARLAPMLAHKWWKTHPQALNSRSIEQAIGGYAMLSLDPVDVALWVDGSMTLARPDYGAACLAALGDDDAAFTRHPWRDCALVEGEYSATLARYSSTRVREQTEFYSRFHPRRWGLIATGAIAWRINDKTETLGRYWWEECLTWSHQDQVSLPVLLRLADENSLAGVPGLRWSMNLPWEQWWRLGFHSVSP